MRQTFHRNRDLQRTQRFHGSVSQVRLRFQSRPFAWAAQLIRVLLRPAHASNSPGLTVHQSCCASSQNFLRMSVSCSPDCVPSPRPHTLRQTTHTHSESERQMQHGQRFPSCGHHGAIFTNWHLGFQNLCSLPNSILPIHSKAFPAVLLLPWTKTPQSCRPPLLLSLISPQIDGTKANVHGASNSTEIFPSTSPSTTQQRAASGSMEWRGTMAWNSAKSVALCYTSHSGMGCVIFVFQIGVPSPPSALWERSTSPLDLPSYAGRVSSVPSQPVSPSRTL